MKQGNIPGSEHSPVDVDVFEDYACPCVVDWDFNFLICEAI